MKLNQTYKIFLKLGLYILTPFTRALIHSLAEYSTLVSFKLVKRENHSILVELKQTL